MTRIRFVLFGLVALVAAAIAPQAQACVTRPTQPPIWILVQGPNTITIIIHGYTSFNAIAPPTCACAFKQVASIGSVNSVQVLVEGTQTAFFPNPFALSNPIGNAFAAAAGDGGTWVGFEAPIAPASVSGGTNVEIRFNVTLAGGSTAADLRTDLQTAGFVIGTDEGDGLGGLTGAHQHIYAASSVNFMTHLPMMSAWGMIAFAGLLTAAAIGTIRRQRRASEPTA